MVWQWVREAVLRDLLRSFYLGKSSGLDLESAGHEYTNVPIFLHFLSRYLT